MRVLVYNTIVKSGSGWRVTYADATGPVVSLVGDDWFTLTRSAQRLFNAEPQPIDTTLQALLWHGKAAMGHVRVMQHMPTDSNFDDLMEYIAKEAP